VSFQQQQETGQKESKIEYPDSPFLISDVVNEVNEPS
jgi:hypothetical protein